MSSLKYRLKDTTWNLKKYYLCLLKPLFYKSLQLTVQYVYFDCSCTSIERICNWTVPVYCTVYSIQIKHKIALLLKLFCCCDTLTIEAVPEQRCWWCWGGGRTGRGGACLWPSSQPTIWTIRKQCAADPICFVSDSNLKSNSDPAF